MAKVLLINGSPRKNGNTHLALMEIAKTLEQQDCTTEIAWIGNKPIRGCIACGTCKRLGNGRCVFGDDICNEIIEKINGADALVVGSPVYYGQPAGQTLALLQRALFAGAELTDKPTAALCVCRRGGATAAFQTLQMPFQMVNAPLVTSQYWNIIYGREEGEAAFDAEGLQTLRQLARNMAWMLRAFAQVPEKPEHEEWISTHFIRPAQE
ncbi:MAG: flavodoxin family protein [Alloprevotella sp.]|nr:flavodoxin family protein [Alloprevotella sp.]